MQGFHEIQFPTNISKGSAGGPERRTQIVTLNSGFEERNSTWAHSRRSYDASLGLRSINDLYAVLSFWEARGGQLYAFRFKDWTDFKSCPPRNVPTEMDQPLAPLTQSGLPLGKGDGISLQYQLMKVYTSGPSSYTRPIRKPIAGSVKVALDGVLQTDFLIDYTTGVVKFPTAPAAGVSITGGYEFDVPVRFNSDKLSVSVDAFEAGTIQAIDLIEVRI